MLCPTRATIVIIGISVEMENYICQNIPTLYLRDVGCYSTSITNSTVNVALCQFRGKRKLNRLLHYNWFHDMLVVELPDRNTLCTRLILRSVH